MGTTTTALTPSSNPPPSSLVVILFFRNSFLELQKSFNDNNLEFKYIILYNILHGYLRIVRTFTKEH